MEKPSTMLSQRNNHSRRQRFLRIMQCCGCFIILHNLWAFIYSKIIFTIIMYPAWHKVYGVGIQRPLKPSSGSWTCCLLCKWKMIIFANVNVWSLCPHFCDVITHPKETLQFSPYSFKLWPSEPYFEKMFLFLGDIQSCFSLCETLWTCLLSAILGSQRKGLQSNIFCLFLSAVGNLCISIWH